MEISYQDIDQLESNKCALIVNDVNGPVSIAHLPMVEMLTLNLSGSGAIAEKNNKLVYLIINSVAKSFIIYTDVLAQLETVEINGELELADELMEFLPASEFFARVGGWHKDGKFYRKNN